MKYKKSVMGYAALLILAFHFYIPFTHSTAETFLYRTAYVGVDIFIMVSAMSLGSRGRINCLPFLKNRLASVYLPFVLFAAAGAVYKSRGLLWFFKAALGIELLERGGGAFLWYAPAILLLYLFAPLLAELKAKYGTKTVLPALAFWFAAAFALWNWGNCPQLFIVVNRIPAFILGFFLDDLMKYSPKKLELPLALAGMLLGAALLYRWGFTARLSKPFGDMYYVLAVPLAAGIIGIFRCFYEHTGLRIVPLEFLGGFTFEIYGCQMLFGYDIMKKVMRVCRNNPLSFLLTAVLILAIAFACSRVFALLRNGLRHQMIKKGET